ncbi:MAG: recombinase RecA [Omnitrophica bacterium RIFCSPHIGHO2_02_FULL_46_11]|nr:MAG: recombinase RecA [Omnitrophica bacterium RIFCSPHIGHO2_02_FULL_46_11]OGW86371.1 MAG: recombinase RecA [Omnitrophica bacterium RIFCSPLOWO2_01_FULL_45_10b]
MSQEKQKALQLTLQQIEKQFGKGAIMTLGQERFADIPAIPTGALTLDIATGIGGVPRGRVVEIYGPEGSGKTTLTLSIAAQVQKRGGVAAFIDAEHALDPTYAKKLGVKLEDLLISQPDSGEQALQIVEMLVRSNALDLIVIDSVAALTPRAEIEGEMGDAQMGLQARLMSQALRKLTAIINRSKTCIIFINQLRQKIGVMFGNPETTPGGKALKFYASMRFDIRRIGSIKKGDEVTGNRVKVKIVKNKCSAPFKIAEFDIMFDEGISRSSSILDLAVLHGVLEKSGSWLAFNQEKLGQGREAVRYFLKENPKLLDEIEAKVKEKLQAVASGEEPSPSNETAVSSESET